MADELLQKYGVPESRDPQADDDILGKYGVGKKADVVPKGDGRGPMKGPVKSVTELPGSFWDALTSPPEDAGAKAMFESMNAMGGYVRSGVAEAAKRIASLGQEGIGSEAWKKTRQGNAPTTDAYLPADMPGRGIVGFAGDVVSDPFNSVLGGPKYLTKPQRPSVWNALLMNAKEPVQPLLGAGSLLLRNPISSGLREAGKRVFRMPFKNADARVSLRFRGAEDKFGPRPYSDYLWNEGDPLTGGFRKTNQELKGDLKGLKQEAYQDMVTEMGPVGDIDLAPKFTEARTNAGDRAIQDERYRIQQLAAEKAVNDIKSRQPKPDGSIPITEAEAARLEAEVAKARAKAYSDALDAFEDPVAREYFSMMASRAEDAFAKTQKKRFRQGIRGEANEREAAIAALKEAVPDLAGMIDENAHRFSTGDQKAAVEFFDQVINDAFAGPRSVDEFQGLTTTYGRNAAGSEPMKSSGYVEGNRVNSKTANNMGVRKNLADLLVDHVEAAATKAEGSLEAGSAARERMLDAKRRYSIMARGEPEALKTIEQAEKAPIFSKIDAFTAASVPFKPWLAVPWMAAKSSQVLNRFPRAATGTGKLLNDVGRSGLWDSMLRRKLLDEATIED